MGPLYKFSLTEEVTEQPTASIPLSLTVTLLTVNLIGTESSQMVMIVNCSGLSTLQTIAISIKQLSKRLC